MSLINAIYYTLFDDIFTYNIIQDIRRAAKNPWSFQPTQTEYIQLCRRIQKQENTVLPATTYLSLDTMSAHNA